MFIDKSMTRSVVTIQKDDSVLKAQEMMIEHKIRHLPVVDDSNYLVGIVTDRDIRSAMPSNLLDDARIEEQRKLIESKTVERIMTRSPVTVSPTYTIQDALLLIQKTKVGAFPVVGDDGKLLGVISVRDLVRSFINVLGIGEPGVLLGILVEEKKGELKKIVDAITEENISFGSVLVARHWEENMRAVFPYLLTNRVAPVKRKLETLGYKLLDPMEWYLDQIPRK